MRRNDPSPAVPAWLQERPESESDTTRRGFRRASRGAETTGSSAPPGDSAPSQAPSAPLEMTASVPFGMVLPPRAAATSEQPETDGAEQALVPDPAPMPPPAEPEDSTLRVSEREAHIDPEPVAPGPGPELPTPDPEPGPADGVEPTMLPASQRLDHRPSNVDLASGVLVRRSRRASGRWRESMSRLTGGRLDGGNSDRHDELVARIRQPISGDYRIAVLSLKGGVGKTTTTVGLGSTFASLRGDCVIAVDANPDFGTLAQRVPLQTTSTVRDLLANAAGICRYSDVRAHTSQAPSRLEVLASERDPAASEAFSEDDYRRVVDILQVYYNVILTDCGTGIMHSAMRGVLDLANTLVLVASPAVDAARSAAATLDWLQAHGYTELVERTVVVISSPRPGSASIDMDALTAHFLARCRAVTVLPFDEHLAEGAEIDLERLRPATRAAFVGLAAMVADDFPALSGRHAGR
ncbi:AAA family ATPase [Rhodococcus sp. NPDC047139]|uniref:MinD/ParA family ATP-binding protein n=1 Tax=Rhodococcus sp. NPDC047139 TaxID=3155141 RepID=UPI0033DB3D42